MSWIFQPLPSAGSPTPPTPPTDAQTLPAVNQFNQHFVLRERRSKKNFRYYPLSLGFGREVTGTQFDQSVSGSISSVTGNLVPRANKVPTGTISIVGSLLKLTQRSYTSTLSSTATPTYSGRAVHGTLTVYNVLL
jgi:hypothetical protein